MALSEGARMSNEPDDAEFTFSASKSSRDDLKKYLSRMLDDTAASVTCRKCGERIEAEFKELLKGVICKCGETVQLNKFDPK